MKSLTLFLLFSLQLLYAKESAEYSSYYTFMAGSYRLIGQDLESNATYSGSVRMENREDHLDVIRTVGDTTMRGVARIVRTLDESPKVLVVTFKETGDKAYYIWHTEFDNYARISGTLERDDTPAAIEALFAIR